MDMSTLMKSPQNCSVMRSILIFMRPVEGTKSKSIYLYTIYTVFADQYQLLCF